MPITPLVVDDIGIPYSYYDSGFKVGMDPLERILGLAEDFDVRIPVAVIAGFLDVCGVSGRVPPNQDAGRIIEFLGAHPDRLPVWNHGLTHSRSGRLTEFQVFADEDRVPEETQRESLALSQEIFREVGLGEPDTLVPPGHAWEPGVTDRLAKELGFRSIAISMGKKTPFRRWLRHPGRPFERTWGASEYLESRFRLGLGISASKKDFLFKDYIKMRQYICPANGLVRLLTQRTRKSEIVPDHFYAHIQNFADAESMGTWRLVLRVLVGWKKRMLDENTNGET
jgi:hypothetical protein